MTESRVFSTIAVHRRQAADLFEALDGEQWDRPSLCAGWTVRDVAGHLVVPFQVSTPGLLWEIVRRRGAVDAAMDHVSRQAARASTEHLVSTLRRHADTPFTPPMLPPEAPLADIAIHLHDVARPLDVELTVPLSTWRPVLDFLVSPAAGRGFVPRARLAGLRLVATDQDWTAGRGPEVHGPSHALALAIAGRESVVGELDGPAHHILAGRLT